jgi:hypothetical protein
MERVYVAMADLVVLAHFAFILFAVTGGLLALRWPRVLWVHAPAAVWAVAIALAGWICPLTPLENWLREASGAAGYEGGFVGHYLLPIVYPTGLTRGIQSALGASLLALNAGIYLWIWRRGRRLRP